jgi:predicted regulator of amino acid metabolism with ACT domain
MSKDDLIEIELENKSSKLCIGFDVGTGTLQAARSDNDKVNITRNVFLELNKDEISISDLSDINYIENEGKIFIIGDDAFRLSNIF